MNMNVYILIMPFNDGHLYPITAYIKGICYLCMSDEKNKHRVPYAFLQDMKTIFLQVSEISNLTNVAKYIMPIIIHIYLNLFFLYRTMV
jgi:hypothetical protein